MKINVSLFHQTQHFFLDLIYLMIDDKIVLVIYASVPIPFLCL